ncbi:MAG: hypothetical protein VX589_05270 [Myxococcota bacterium]|nr:hypothetical protein [Myxococcota bacterium]
MPQVCWARARMGTGDIRWAHGARIRSIFCDAGGVSATGLPGSVTPMAAQSKALPVKGAEPDEIGRRHRTFADDGRATMALVVGRSLRFNGIVSRSAEKYSVMMAVWLQID